MRCALLLLCLSACSSKTPAEGFDALKPGAAPAGWECGTTGAGAPKWQVEADDSAPSRPHVLKQSGEADFPWCVRSGASLESGAVEVRFKLLSGEADQAGGVLWKWKGPGDYYVARANALEQNVEVFRTLNGHRKSIKSTDLPVAAKEWHHLRVEFSGPRYTVFFDGKRVLEGEDAEIQGTGLVGVWTKADSVTAFDAFAFTRSPH
jgi:hypothetical protein